MLHFVTLLFSCGKISIGCPYYSYIYKVGGISMIKKEAKISVITILLIGILIGIIASTVKSTYLYYYGPEYKVDCYVQYLNQREYDKLVRLLSTDSIKDLGDRGDIENYYRKVYERENKLVSVEKIGRSRGSFNVKYQFATGAVKGQLNMVKEKGRWRIAFPFEAYDVEVFAPFGCQIYLDSNKLTYNSTTGKYEVNDILPGTYLLKVIFDQGRYKDYYKAVRIPEECSIEVPYDTTCVSIQCAPNLKVSLGQFSKVSTGDKVTFNDILLDDYTIKVEDEKGNFKSQEYQVSINKNNHNFKFKEFVLTEEGKVRLEAFIADFYNEYIDAVSTRKTSALESYFSGVNKQEQLNLFSQWYIDKKEIEQVKMNLKVGESYMDERGQIHVPIRETSQLYNREYDENLEQEVVKCYKVILDVDTTINVLEKDWKVVDRQIIQSLVAVQDQEGRWVQY